jgi:hypothetical protein
VARLTVDDRGRVGGGIVAGIAYDQSSLPAIGVTITNGGNTVTTTATPGDSAVADGFYRDLDAGGNDCDDSYVRRGLRQSRVQSA